MHFFSGTRRFRDQRDYFTNVTTVVFKKAKNMHIVDTFMYLKVFTWIAFLVTSIVVKLKLETNSG